MPQAYVKKLSQKHGISTQKGEGKWAKAKAAAAAQGHADDYGYVTSIFKNMMHETPYIPTLKDLTKGMSFKYFLVAEDDSQQQREHSATYKHLAQFPQFNELPFKVRRDLEREVDAEGLLSDFEALDPEEKESVNDALLDMVIDKMQDHFGTGINLAPPDTAPVEDTEDEPEVVLAPRKRESSGPRHIAAMRAATDLEQPTADDELPDADEVAPTPMAGTRKSYYKPWSALSDEQRAGRAALAAKHGKMYRVKNSKWFKALDPAKQQAVIDAVKAGQEIPKF